MRLQHQLACAASLLTLSLAGAASAAATDWSGFYVGATAGGTFTNNRFELPGDVDDVLKSDHAGASSFTGGGLVGFNYQRDNLVAGVEGDYTFGNSSATVVACNVTDGCFTSAHDSFTTYNRLHEDGVGRVRVRFGVARASAAE